MKHKFSFQRLLGWAPNFSGKKFVAISSYKDWTDFDKIRKKVTWHWSFSYGIVQRIHHLNVFYWASEGFPFYPHNWLQNKYDVENSSKQLRLQERVVTDMHLNERRALLSFAHVSNQHLLLITSSFDNMINFCIETTFLNILK